MVRLEQEEGEIGEWCVLGTLGGITDGISSWIVYGKKRRMMPKFLVG